MYRQRPVGVVADRDRGDDPVLDLPTDLGAVVSRCSPAVHPPGDLANRVPHDISCVWHASTDARTQRRAAARHRRDLDQRLSLVLAPGDRQGLVPAPRRTGRRAPAPRMAARAARARTAISTPRRSPPASGEGRGCRPPVNGDRPTERCRQLASRTRWPASRTRTPRCVAAMVSPTTPSPSAWTLTAARSPMTCGGCGTTARDHRAADPGSDPTKLSTAPYANRPDLNA